MPTIEEKINNLKKTVKEAAEQMAAAVEEQQAQWKKEWEKWALPRKVKKSQDKEGK
jgi:hypothetical protein